jgi:hypothetical protein
MNLIKSVKWMHLTLVRGDESSPIMIPLKIFHSPLIKLSNLDVPVKCIHRQHKIKSAILIRMLMSCYPYNEHDISKIKLKLQNFNFIYFDIGDLFLVKQKSFCHSFHQLIDHSSSKNGHYQEIL